MEFQNLNSWSGDVKMFIFGPFTQALLIHFYYIARFLHPLTLHEQLQSTDMAGVWAALMVLVSINTASTSWIIARAEGYSGLQCNSLKAKLITD